MLEFPYTVYGRRIVTPRKNQRFLPLSLDLDDLSVTICMELSSSSDVSFCTGGQVAYESPISNAGRMRPFEVVPHRWDQSRSRIVVVRGEISDVASVHFSE